MNGISRAELLAQNALGTGADRIKAALHEIRVVLGISRELSRTRLGQIGILTSANVLCRLGALAPELYFDIPRDTAVLPGVPLLHAGRSLAEELLALGKRLAGVQAGLPRRELAGPRHRYDLGLYVGSVTSQVGRPVCVGADGWLAGVRADGGNECLETTGDNPLGIILAAALGSAEIVKWMWQPIAAPSVVIEPIQQRVVVSAYDFGVNASSPPNPGLPRTYQLGHACMVGLGATGSGCVFVLGCLPTLQMSLDFVDADVIEPVNEERLFTGADPRADVGQRKVTHARAFMQNSHPGVSVFEHPIRFQQYVDGARDRLGYVFCGLDSAAARCELQTELATVISNGGTDASRWVFSWHDFEQPNKVCLIDLYPTNRNPNAQIEQELARLLALGLRERPVRALGNRGRVPVDRARIQAAERRRMQAARALAAGNREQALAHVCSTMRPTAAGPAATISFVALMPAIAMVSDFVKRRVLNWRPGPNDPNVYSFDTLRLPTRGRRLSLLAGQHCQCQTESFRHAFAERQRLRTLYLHRLFTKPAGSHHDEARIPARVPQPPQAAVPEQVERNRLRPGPALAGWRALGCRVAAIFLCAGALIWYLACMAGTAWLLSQIAAGGAATDEVAPPWRLIEQAWTTRLSLWQWARFSGICAGTTAAYLVAGAGAMAVARLATGVYCRMLRCRPNPGSRMNRLVLGLVRPTGLLWIHAGLLPWLTITVRLLGLSAVFGCCFIFLLLPFFAGLVLAVVGRMTQLPWVYSSAFQRRLY